MKSQRINQVTARLNQIRLDSIQESSDRLYAMLLDISGSENRNQIYINTLIQVLKSLPTIKPLEFDKFY